MAPNMNVPVMANLTMEPRDVLSHRQLEPLTPLHPVAWHEMLARTNLENKYPLLTRQLIHGFNAGILHIPFTYTPPNNLPTYKHLHAFQEVVDNEFRKGRYIGPFTHTELTLLIGNFQTSPVSMVPKPGKPGHFHLVQNLSYPHTPQGPISSINHSINSDLYPSTWGTFSTICTTIWSLPPGSQGAVHDIAEAYRSIPVAASQWPGLVVRLDDDSFAVDTNACFGCALSSGNFGHVADARADIFRANGIGPLSKWVNDHIFFWIPHTFLKQYNQLQEHNWQCISDTGGVRQDGGHIWFKG